MEDSNSQGFMNTLWGSTKYWAKRFGVPAMFTVGAAIGLGATDIDIDMQNFFILSTIFGTTAISACIGNYAERESDFDRSRLKQENLRLESDLKQLKTNNDNLETRLSSLKGCLEDTQTDVALFRDGLQQYYALLDGSSRNPTNQEIIKCVSDAVTSYRKLIKTMDGLRPILQGIREEGLESASYERLINLSIEYLKNFQILKPDQLNLAIGNLVRELRGQIGNFSELVSKHNEHVEEATRRGAEAGANAGLQKAYESLVKVVNDAIGKVDGRTQAVVKRHFELTDGLLKTTENYHKKRYLEISEQLEKERTDFKAQISRLGQELKRLSDARKLRDDRENVGRAREFARAGLVYNDVINTIRNPVAVADTEGKVFVANRAFAAAVGKELDAILDKDYSTIITGTGLETVAYTSYTPVSCSDGKTRYFRLKSESLDQEVPFLDTTLGVNMNYYVFEELGAEVEAKLALERMKVRDRLHYPSDSAMGVVFIKEGKIESISASVLGILGQREKSSDDLIGKDYRSLFGPLKEEQLKKEGQDVISILDGTNGSDITTFPRIIANIVIKPYFVDSMYCGTEIFMQKPLLR